MEINFQVMFFGSASRVEICDIAKSVLTISLLVHIIVGFVKDVFYEWYAWSKLSIKVYLGFSW